MNHDDPFPVSALLRSAVARARASLGCSQNDVARLAGLEPPNLSRALAEDSEARPSTVRAVLQVAVLRLALVATDVCGSCDGTGRVRYASGTTEPCPFCGPLDEEVTPETGGPSAEPPGAR